VEVNTTLAWIGYDRTKDVKSKVVMWLATGCRLVWVLDPKKRTVTVHAPEENSVSLSAKDAITGREVLPGFRVRVSEFFSDLDLL
jgi:Uma2 family endonuclease